MGKNKRAIIQKIIPIYFNYFFILNYLVKNSKLSKNREVNLYFWEVTNFMIDHKQIVYKN